MSDLEKRVDIGIPDNILQAGRLLTDYFRENKVTCFMGLASRDKYEELSEREKSRKERYAAIKNEEWQKPLSKEDVKNIQYVIMEKCLDAGKPGDSGHFLLRILYNIDCAIEREKKLVEALRFYADERNWFSCCMGCSSRPEKASGELDEGETASATLRELGIEESV